MFQLKDKYLQHANNIFNSYMNWVKPSQQPLLSNDPKTLILDTYKDLGVWTLIWCVIPKHFCLAEVRKHLVSTYSDCSSQAGRKDLHIPPPSPHRYCALFPLPVANLTVLATITTTMMKIMIITISTIY